MKHEILQNPLLRGLTDGNTELLIQAYQECSEYNAMGFCDIVTDFSKNNAQLIEYNIDQATFFGTGNYYNFDGVNDYLEQNPTNMNFGTSLTLQIYTKRGRTATTEHLFTTVDNGNAGVITIFLNAATNWNYQIRLNGSVGTPRIIQYNDTDTSNYHALQLTYDGDALRGYFDGTALTPLTGLSDSLYYNGTNQSFRIGMHTAGVLPYLGKIKLLTLSDRVLTSQELQNFRDFCLILP